MNNKELLELAAKAAGIELIQNDSGEFGYYIFFRDHLPQWNEWNPLTDDGDALRLAVKLNLCVNAINTTVKLCGSGKVLVHETHGAEASPYVAIRRAIVRAAAEIGKDRKE